MERSDDTSAQVGIGAMIVFIASLLAIATTAHVMMLELEKIAQTTEKTVSVATNAAHTQIVFVGGWIDDDYDDYLFMIEYQSLGQNVVTDEVGWILWCELNGNIYRRYGFLGDPLSSAPAPGGGQGVTIWPVGENLAIPDELESGKRYFVIADGGTGSGSAGNGAGPANACGPKYIYQNGISAYYSIYLPNGGHMTQELRITDYAVGESVT